MMSIVRRLPPKALADPGGAFCWCWHCQGSTGAVTGWVVKLQNAAAKHCGSSIDCQQADGRVYTVRVCAKDQAGE
jgi:hypothetical protein